MGRRAKHPLRPAGRISCGIDIPEEHAPAVRAQQVSAITRLTRPLMLVNLMNAVLLIAVLRFTDQLSPPALVWGGVAAAVSLLSLLRAQIRGKRPTPDAVSRRTIRRVVRSSALFGLLWAVPGLVVLPDATGLAQAFCASLLTGMVGGGAIALYPIPMAAAVFAAFVCLGSILGLAFHGMLMAAAFAASATGFFFVFTRVILQHTRTFVDEYVGRLELEKRNKLISDLLEQTQLEAVGERQRSEQRLVRAQKMEAIGQLTGGVAHDFNNLLAAIQGHAELIELEGRADPHLVTPILSATARGAALIQRLLSVARKQVLKPEAVDLDDLVRELLLLLQRTLGPHIRIETQVPEGLWPPLADAGQLEGALLNLALNARGAMPEGGTLMIECANVDADSARRRPLELKPGDYVEIVVRDTGHGMSPSVRERALDPFFTTKKFGSGSGLGLSIVAGFIQQSEGQIQIESAPGAGTAVHLLLPRAEAAQAAPDTRAPRRTAVGNGETILVVEDEADVRDITVRMLEGLNYRVLTSGDARDALRKIVTDRTIDLVLTDILLPGGMTGFELARNVDRMAPALPVTFMSG
ncbi:MAG: response regulator [Rhodobacteraceae bacterium]|nr:response regulator [Paracoccaceae bacterium]